MSREISERLQWFLDRVGKRVYRNPTDCNCEICYRIGSEGLLINDELHANYLYDCEGEFTADGAPLRYFDTKQEVNEWLNTIQK